MSINHEDKDFLIVINKIASCNTDTILHAIESYLDKRKELAVKIVDCKDDDMESYLIDKLTSMNDILKMLIYV